MLAENIRKAQILKLDKGYLEVIEANLHKGSATTGMMIHLRLRNIETGTLSEARMAPTDKVEEAPVDLKEMQFLYAQGDSLIFMDPDNFDQLTLDKRAMGPAVPYLKEEMRVPIRFHGEKAFDVRFPETVDVKVASTGNGIRGQGDTPYKPATLENGVEVQVPPFVETGDTIRVEVAANRYIERLQGER